MKVDFDDLEKKDEQNHVKKGFSKKLYELSKTFKELKHPDVIPYIVRCFMYAVKENTGSVENIQLALKRMVLDIFGDHTLCENAEWCTYAKDPFNFKSAITRKSVSGFIKDIIVETIESPEGIAIDWIYNLLYWTDAGHDHIQVSRLDGTDRKTIIQNDGSLDKPRPILVDPNTGLLFFSDWGSQKRIERCRMDGGDRKVILDSDIAVPDGMTIGTNVCEKNNGGCSHICFPLPAYTSDRSTQSGCMCPDFYALLSNNKTCISIEPPENVTIDVVSSSVTVSWEFPETLDHIVQSELQLYDREESVVYNRIQYYPVSKHSITAIQFQECHRYKIKLRCQYSNNGWSPYIEQTFWPTENMIHSDISNNINITWTTSTDRTDMNTMFYSLADTEKTIFTNGIPVDNSQKYKNLIKNGLNIQFTLQQVQIADVGLYQSVSAPDNTVIDGCTLLVVTEKPKVPTMTYDKQPFVGSASVFSCSSVAQRHPMYLVTDLQYNWSTSGMEQGNTLTIDSIAKTNKGKIVSCTVTDDRGKVSDSSYTVILDPYYGPESVRLTTLSEAVIVALGSYFTITCLATCYPVCTYLWTRVLNGVISDMTNAQTYTIDVVSQSDSGMYSCIVTHQHDSSRKGNIDVLINVVEADTSTSVLMTETEFSSQGMTTADAATQLPDNSNVGNRQTDKGVTSNDVIIYPVIAAVSVIVVTVVVILVCWRRRRTPPPKMARPFEEPDKRVSTMSTVSDIYDTIEEQKELTTNMYNPNSEYLDPYHGLSSSGRNPTYIYSDLMRKHGDVNMQESIVARNENTDIGNDTIPRSSNDESGLPAFSNPVGYGVVDTIWSNKNSDTCDYLSPINFNGQ